MDQSGKVRSTIEERRSKGYGIVSEILAIVNDIPLGQYKMEIGLMLRQAMLLNGVLFNSEAWHAISEKEIKLLEAVDEHLLRSLVGGHAKTPLEFLYLEAGAIPIRYIISCRRMIYHQTILNRPDEELTKRVYNAQKESPTDGDFYRLVKADWEMIGENLDEVAITSKSAEEHKRTVKGKIRNAAHRYLLNLQAQHSKVRDIKYLKLETQEYMTSPIFTNDDVNFLHATRSRSLDCKINFRNKYINDDLLCRICKTEEEDQPHILLCKVLQSKLKSEQLARGQVTYSDAFSNHFKQKEFITLFRKMWTIREKLLEEQQCDPSTAELVLKNSYNLPQCIVNYSSGN